MRDCDTLTKILDVRTGTAALQWLQCDRQAAATAVGATLSRLLIERTNTTTRRTYARRQPLDTINRGPRWRHRLTDNMHFWSDGSNWRGCFARTAWNLKTVIFSQRLKLLTTIDSEVGIMTWNGEWNQAETISSTNLNYISRAVSPGNMPWTYDTSNIVQFHDVQ